MRPGLLVWLAFVAAASAAGCGAGTAQDGGAGGAAMGTGGSGAGGGGGTAGKPGSGGSGAGGASACLGGGFMGSSKLLIGASMSDATAAAAPFDARYLYICGGLPDAGACTSCSAACGFWWGCWQDYAQAPGQYAASLVSKAEAAKWQNASRPQIPVFTYYQELQGSKLSEGTAQVAAINDAAFVARYLQDWRLLLTTIGQHRAMLHIEPDFWGYVRNVSSNPHQVPAKVKTGNATDCASEEDSAAGFATCMIHMVRKYAPNAKVGLHASAWLMGSAGDGQAIGTFLTALGAGEGDFLVTDPCDRDAGYYDTQGRDVWWDDAKAQAYLAWSKTVAETVNKPMIFWQIPLGNMSQTNTTDHWKDNKLDWLFAHTVDLANAHVIALLFGAGAGGQTTPETDGGNLVAKTTSYFQSGATDICQ